MAKKQEESKTFKEIFEQIVTNKDKADMALAMVNLAKQGNARAFQIVRDAMGESSSSVVVGYGLLEDALDRLSDD